MAMINNTYQKGSILLEVFIAVMVIGITFASLLDVGAVSVKTSTLIQNNSRANFLLKEEIEAIRSFRDGTTWSSNGLGSGVIAMGAPYNLAVNADAWTLVSGAETTGIFTRQVIFNNVSRDGSGNIVSSGGTNDPSTKKATVTVSWPGKTLNLVTYFTNWKL